MKRVLVTGASGFIGRHCLPLLADREYEVFAVARQTSTNPPGVRWCKADLLDESQTKALLAEVRPSHLLHLAWYTEHGKFWRAPDNFAWVRASMTLLEAFHHAGGQRFVQAGTCAEYDWRAGHCLEYETALLPSTEYGTCKNALQQLTAAYAAGTGMSGAWGRIFHLYGPHENPARLVPYVITALLRGQEALCTHGEQVRDFMHAQDTASAFVSLLDSRVEGPVNIGSGQAIALKEVIGIIADHLQCPQLVKLGAVASSSDPPRLTPEVARLRDEVRWSPSFTLRRGLAQTIAWWRDQRLVT